MSKEQATLEKESPYRLPEFALPVDYEIRLAPDLTTFKCPGTVDIELDIVRPTNYILLNARDLEIESAQISHGDASQPSKEQAKIALEAEDERLRLSFDKTIPAGKARLTIKFCSEINDKLRGFYRSAQTLPSGEKSWIGVTQFESTDARRAFPCFDEPAFKATFKLTMEVDPALTAIANTLVESEKIDEKSGKKVVSFARTMKMATYIVAFVVGLFDKTEAVDVDGIPFRIYAPVGKIHLAPFALEVGTKALAFFNKYYGIKYAGGKMDMIAVPDFAFGAMENNGCVVYRETALLVDPDKASQGEKERVAEVVAHELAHMWFGNLTTMKWWNGIWLNEAFATFMALVAVDAMKPEWNYFENFGVSRALAFATDGLRATRTIEFPVSKPDEASGMFDVLTYQKGASVLRMIEQYIGADKFKAGVNAYLNKHKFANTETSDLWQSLGEAASEPVGEIMDSWIFQEGHPLVSVSLSPDKKSITLKQERFYYLPDSKGASKQLFQVPLLLRAKTESGSIEKRVLLKEASMTVKLEGDKAAQSVLVNAGGHGFYRVAYSEELLNQLKQDLPSLTVLERFNLISDLWALTVNGTLKLQAFLDFVRLFKDEKDKNVWTVILGALQYIDRVFYKEEAKVSAYTRELLAPSFKRLGWQGKKEEDALSRQLRGMIIATLGTIGDDKEVLAEAGRRYDEQIAGKGEMEPDVLGASISILAHHGDEKRYDQFEKFFAEAKSPQELDRYMYALTAFRNEKLLERTLAKTLNGEIKSQNAPFVVRGVMLNPWGRSLGWHFVRDNWDKVRTLFPTAIITRMVEGVTGLIDEKMAAEVFTFFSSHPVPEGQKTADQHLEKLKVALAFMSRENL